MRIFLLMASLLPILWGLIGVEIDALDCQSISLSQIEWVASINEDVNPDTPNNHAEVVEGSDTYGDYYGMCWNSPMFTDLSLNGVDQFDREDIRSVSLTLSASEEMEVAVVVRVAVADCGEGWRYAIADERLHVTTVPQEFTVPYSEFSDNPFGSCSGPLSEHALEGIDSIVLLPSSREGEIRVYRVSLCNSDYLASSNRTIPSSEDATGSATSALDWQMILTEPGVTRYVLRCQFPEDSQELVGLQLAQLDASGREGIEFLIGADPSTPIRVWIVWAKEDSGGGEETLEWRSAVDPIQAGPEAHVFRLAFEQFCLQEDYTTANGCGVKINAIRGIYFEPLSTNVELEISYLALYSSLGTMIFTQVIDQYSLWSVEKPGEWVVGSRASIEFAGKPIMETLDLVVVGADWGEGRRANLIGSYLLACYDPDTSEFLEIGRVGTGITDEQLSELTNLFSQYIISEDGKTIELQPAVVFEIAYEEIQKSPHYASGYALRFPRLVRVRFDKTPEDADSVERVEWLAGRM